MKKFTIEGFEVITNSDLTEGRGRSVTVAYTSNEIVAEKIAVGKGVMGTNAEVKPVFKTIYVYDHYSEYEERNIEKDRERALNKLTKKERILLGLK